MNVRTALGLTWLVAMGSIARAQSNLPPGFVTETIGSGWVAPVGIAFGEPGQLLVVEKRGYVWLVEDGVKGDAPLLDINQEALNNGDRGLLGIAVDPSFDVNGYLYLLLVADPNHDGSDGEQEAYGRLVRYTVSHDAQGEHIIDPQSRLVLLGASFGTGIPSCHFSHAIGTIRFLDDGSLVCGAGDGAHYDLTDGGGYDPGCFLSGRVSPDQDIGAFRSVYPWTLAGKLLRVDPATGLGLPDNPYYTGDPGDIRSRIWVSGLRNPYRFNVQPGSGPRNDLYISDVGWNTFEELNHARGGENFGWPCYEGGFEQSSYQSIDASGLCDGFTHTPPVLFWHHSSASYAGFIGNCASGLAFYTGTEYPPLYRNALFFTDYGRSWMKIALLDHNGGVSQVVHFADGFAGPVDVEADPQSGDLYVVSVGNDRIARLRYVLGNQSPVAILDADATYGPVPLTVNLSASQSYDPENEGLTYLWDLGDGTSADVPAVVKTYASAVNANVVLTVTDARGKSSQASVLVSPGNTPPTTTVVAPHDGDFYHGGDTIVLDASAQDTEDDQAGTPLSALWTVNLVHDHHVHPDFYQQSGFTGSFVASSHGSGTYLEVQLDVTDSRGLVTRSTANLYDADAIPKAHIVSVDREAPRLHLPVTATGHAEYPGKGALDLTWDWGDGASDSFPGVTHQQDTSPTHTYADIGWYTITLTAAAAGQSTTQTLAIEVTRPKPAVAVFVPLVVQRWLTQEQQTQLAEALVQALQATGTEVRVFVFNEQDQLAQWMQDYLQDGVCDLLVMMDVVPAAIYQGEDEGSLAEQWVENGNGILWTGQQAFSEYLDANAVTDTSGAGAVGADDILDPSVPQIATGIGTMIPREDATDLPSFEQYFARKALIYDRIGPAWHVARLYGSNNMHNSDAIALRHSSGGFYAQFYGSYRTDIPRAQVMIEFIDSYLLGRSRVPAANRRMNH